MLRRSILFVSLLFFTLLASAGKKPSYLFAWGGDTDKKGSDFLAVIDASPDSPTYGKILRTVTTGTTDSVPHHTEIEMPPGGFLMANGFEAGRTWVFDLRRPLAPRIAATFSDLNGYMHPHTYYRLRNGNTLTTFQYHGGHEPKSEAGGLLEIDDRGKLLRSGSSADPAARGELIRPYSLELLPQFDRIVTTNTAMHAPDGESRTVQIWQFSRLKVLRTLVLPPGPHGDEQLFPGEPRLLDDGKTVMVHTFNCGLYLMRDIATDHAKAQFVYAFPKAPHMYCGVPLRVGHFWLATVNATHSLTVLDIADPAHPREVSRVSLDETELPHWISIDSTHTRVVLTSAEKVADRRLYIINFDPTTGAAKLDERFRDAGSDKPGVKMNDRELPHGFRGNTYVHGVVFSR